MSTRFLPPEVRDRLRAHQELESKVVAATTAATARREAAIARRKEIVAGQDELVEAAVAYENQTMVELAATSGIERAAAILNLPVPALRKLVKTTDSASRTPSGSATTRGCAGGSSSARPASA
jgi:hypothetical protein